MVELSLVLPCYRAAALARQSVARIQDRLRDAPYTWEVIVVDDGGDDFETDPWAGDPRVRLVRLPHNRGKGAAVKTGILAASGRVRVFTDVDLPYGLDSLPLMLEYILRRGFHLVVGDRTLPGSTYALNVGTGRRAASRVFSAFVGRLVTGGFYDTQCGIKALRGDVAAALFPLVRTDRFAFDVELIYIALKARADIKRLNVQLESNATSSVRLWRDSIRGVIDVLQIKRHELAGRYSSSALTALLSNDMVHAAALAADHFSPTSTAHAACSESRETG